MVPLINGEAYSFAQIELRLFNVVVAGIVSIDYSDKREMINNMGAGQYPVSRSYGKYEATAKIELEVAEVVALQKAVPSGRLQDIPEFDIPVAFIPEGSVEIVVDVLRNVRFMSNGRSGKSGDAKGMTVPLELIVSHISYHHF